MDRRKFIRQSCLTCLAGLPALGLLQGCSTGRYLKGTIKEDYMLVNENDFLLDKKNPNKYRPYIIVENEMLKFPICIYRFSSTDYEALWLECTHQGAELQVFGDKLQCPAHGSEFSNRGAVQNGPASRELRKFPVTLEGKQLKISLK